VKKIVWIASYPKSGNTWIRYLISNYFFNEEKKFESNIITNIKKFNVNKALVKNQNFNENPYNISKYWIKSQEELKILNGDVVFLKTHNALLNINNNEFTNNDLSLAIIYVVRDPRDIVISYSKYKNLSIDDTIEHLISKNLVYVQNNNNPLDIEIIGSWALNYNSWKNGISQIPRIIVRYEDLINDCSHYFFKVIEFLSQHMNFKINYNKLKSSVELSKFENLKKIEIDNRFSENQGSDNFFKTGKYNNWKNVLNLAQVKKIENSLNLEMKELEYIE